jgi:endonuclease/exonuclease/phosphatase family metal-dependent hydrolase
VFRLSRVGLAVVATCSCVVANAQTIPQKGTADTFDIATWNIEWFGSNGGPTDDALQFAHVVAVMRQAGIDLWAVQEISDPDDFDALVDSLGEPYEGALATESGSQRIGFIFNTDLVSLRSNPRHILTTFDDEFATRPPLQLEADVTVSDSTRTLTFITLHMKCCGSADDHARRAAAAGRLKNHIDFSILHDQPVIILGDFNDELDDSIADGLDTPYRAILNDVSRYRFVTLPLNEDNRNTYCSSSQCGSGSTLDHILITNELFADFESGTADHFLELTDVIAGYVQNTSDHLPVYAHIRYGIRTDVDSMTPAAFVVGRPYPNPASDQVVIPISGRAQGAATFEVYDLLGRRVTEQAEVIGYDASDGWDGYERGIRIRTGRLPQGFYHVRITNGSEDATRTFVVVR